MKRSEPFHQLCFLELNQFLGTKMKELHTRRKICYMFRKASSFAQFEHS